MMWTTCWSFSASWEICSNNEIAPGQTDWPVHLTLGIPRRLEERRLLPSALEKQAMHGSLGSRDAKQQLKQMTFEVNVGADVHLTGGFKCFNLQKKKSHNTKCVRDHHSKTLVGWTNNSQTFIEFIEVFRHQRSWVIQPTFLSEDFIAGLAAVWKRRNILDGLGWREAGKTANGIPWICMRTGISQKNKKQSI